MVTTVLLHRGEQLQFWKENVFHDKRDDHSPPWHRRESVRESFLYWKTICPHGLSKNDEPIHILAIFSFERLFSWRLGCSLFLKKSIAKVYVKKSSNAQYQFKVLYVKNKKEKEHRNFTLREVKHKSFTKCNRSSLRPHTTSEVLNPDHSVTIFMVRHLFYLKGHC